MGSNFTRMAWPHGPLRRSSANWVGPTEGSTMWSLDVASYQDVTLPMKVVRLGSIAPACAVD